MRQALMEQAQRLGIGGRVHFLDSARTCEASMRRWMYSRSSLSETLGYALWRRWRWDCRRWGRVWAECRRYRAR